MATIDGRTPARYQNAYGQGAQHRRAGVSFERMRENFNDPIERSYACSGWHLQNSWPGQKCDFSFYLKHVHGKEASAIYGIQRWKDNEMRTADELTALKADYEATYNAYADAERAAGREPQTLDEAFMAHLEALDGSDAGKKASGGGKKAAKKAATKGAAAKAAKGGSKAATGAKAATKPAPAAKAPKTPKAKAFRPTSDDRKAVNAAAQKALGKDAKGGNHRLKLADGSPYVDFLQGRAIKMDDKGNGGPLILNVYTGADPKTVRGTVTLTVKGGNLTAVGKKA